MKRAITWGAACSIPSRGFNAIPENTVDQDMVSVHKNQDGTIEIDYNSQINNPRTEISV